MADAFDYLESRDDADELIQEFGQVVSLRRTTNSGTAWAPTQSVADYATYGARVAFTLRQLQRGNVLDTDERWLVAAGPLAASSVTSVAAPDALLVNGTPKQIVRADPINPAGTPVMFDCQVRT